MSSRLPLWRRIVATLAWTFVGAGLLFVGFRVAKGFVEAKPKAGRSASWTKPVPVQTARLTLARERAVVRAMGTVMPARELAVQVEVSGKLLDVHPQLQPGGLVSKDDVLLRVDDRDYALAVKVRKADIASAQLGIKTEKRRRAVAEREWALLESEVGLDAEGRALSLREPQLLSAEAQLSAVKSALEAAQLQLARTVVRSPLNAMVVQETVEPGQLVAPGARVATLVGTDSFWIRVAVPFDKLALFKVPGVNASEGARAVVRVQSRFGSVLEREGRVARLLGEVDAVGRMAQVLVEVNDPLQLSLAEEQRAMPLLLGAQVRVDIEGDSLDDVYSIPVASLHEGNVVHLFSDPVHVRLTAGNLVDFAPEISANILPSGSVLTFAAPRVVSLAIGGGWSQSLGRLDVRPVQLEYRDIDTVLVRAELPSDRQLITSRIAGAVRGMWVRPKEQPTAAALRDNGPGQQNGPQGAEVAP